MSDTSTSRFSRSRLIFVSGLVIGVVLGWIARSLAGELLKGIAIGVVVALIVVFLAARRRKHDHSTAGPVS
jgi:uncharacterized membrane protein YfcA